MYERLIPPLGGCRLFSGIGQGQLGDMLECLRPTIRRFERGQNITPAGEKLPGIGIVLTGQVSLVKETAEGDRLIIARLSPGATFGEAAAFASQGVAPSTVMAESESQVLFFSAESILGHCPRMCPSHTALIQNAIRLVADKAQQLDRKIDVLLIKSMRGRIAAYLIDLYGRGHQTSFTLPYNRRELAEYLGVSRPSLSRELGRMGEEGLLRFQGNRFTLLDPAALARCADRPL